MSKRLGMTVALLLIALVAAACGGGADTDAPASSAPAASSSPAETQRIEVLAKEPFAYDPGDVTVKKGTQVELVLKNDGSVVHDLHIDDFGVSSARLAAGESETITFTANQVGTFKMYCAEPGHEIAGMVGTFTVVE